MRRGTGTSTPKRVRVPDLTGGGETPFTRSANKTDGDETEMSKQWPAPLPSLWATICECCLGINQSQLQRADPLRRLEFLVSSAGPMDLLILSLLPALGEHRLHVREGNSYIQHACIMYDGNMQPMHGAETLLASQGMRGLMYSVMYDAQKHCSPHHEPPFMTSSMG